MNRLQKKCFIVSAGLHLLLAVMVVAGSAFLASRAEVNSPPVLDFVSPDMIPIDGNAVGGGGPMTHPPVTQPVQQAPVQPPPQPPQVPQAVVQPQPKPQLRPEPVKTSTPEPPKIIKPSPDAFETPKEPKHKIVVDTTIVKGTSKDAQAAKEAQLAADRAAAKRAADAQKRLAAMIGHTATSLKSGMSGATDIKFNTGFGGTGPAYANWSSIIKTIYYNEWSQRLPDSLMDDSAKAEATVTIARDGTVLNAELTKPSGNAAVDRSIQTTIDRVKFTSRFPDSSKEEQTQVILEFSVKALKQLMG